jgi:hypothetical protein
MSARSPERQIVQADERQIEGGVEPQLMDRRGMLTTVAATAAGLIGAMGVPGVAMAAHGDPVLAGVVATVGGSETALSGSNTSSAGGGVGVQAESLAGDAVVADSSGACCCGVTATAQGIGGVGVAARGVSMGVWGRPTNSSANGDGVWGEATAGVGVKAKATTGTALKVEGKASFTRSGVASIARKKSSVTFAVPGGVTGSSRFLVTMQGSLGSGVYIAYAQRSGTTKLKVALNKKSTKKASVAWMVLD